MKNRICCMLSLKKLWLWIRYRKGVGKVDLSWRQIAQRLMRSVNMIEVKGGRQLSSGLFGRLVIVQIDLLILDGTP